MSELSDVLARLDQIEMRLHRVEANQQAVNEGAQRAAAPVGIFPPLDGSKVIERLDLIVNALNAMERNQRR